MKKLIFITFLLFNMQLFAQNGTTFFKEKYRDTTQIEKLSTRIAYYGIYTFHPGLKVGVEYPIKRKVKEISKFPFLSFLGILQNNKTKVIHNDWISSANFAFYNHRDNNSGFILNAELARRRTGKHALYREINMGFGFMKTFQPTTYEMTNSGEIDKKFLPGHFYKVINLGLAFGFDCSVKKATGISMYIKPTYFIMFPYNSLLTINSALEIGFTYKFVSNPFKK